MDLEKIKKIAEKQMDEFEETGNKEGMVTFDFEGTDIINPFEDETGRIEVDPEAYYGEAFLKSEWITVIETEKMKEKMKNIKEDSKGIRFGIIEDILEERDPQKHFVKRLNMMIQSASNLSRVWEDLDEDFNRTVTENYPFDKEFSEMIEKMIEWRDKIKI